MDGKTEREKLMEEFKRINREKFEKFYRTICESFDDFLNRQSLAKVDWEMKCPYVYGKYHWVVYDDGEIGGEKWVDSPKDDGRFLQGNVFLTEEAALLEAKRRNLLTRFGAFRDECNGDWKPNWNDINQDKYVIKLEEKKDFYIALFWTVNEFNLFGYFKDDKNAQRAIELFGDEIKELFVDCEV